MLLDRLITSHTAHAFRFKPLSQSGDIHLEFKVKGEPCNLNGGTSGLRGEELAEDLVDRLKVGEVYLHAEFISFWAR